MGSGFKDWTAGDVLTAGDVDGYLMRQTLMTFASSAARDTALSGVLDEGMVAFLEDTDAITYYTGAAWRTIFLPETSWSPTWTNLTVGNGSVNAFYTRTGDIVHASVRLSWGTSTSITGTGVSITLPVACDTSVQYAGSAVLVDASSTAQGGGSRVAGTVWSIVSGTGAISATAPFTWTTSDEIIATVAYTAA